jgi:hypothetical protein
MAATKTPIFTDNAPKPLPGIYSQAIVANGMVYCSGAVPMDAETGKLIDGDIKAHTVRLLPLLPCRPFVPHSSFTQQLKYITISTSASRT